MLAYVKTIEMYDDDNEPLGVLTHDCDEMYLYTPPEGVYISPSDFRFIAKVMESELCSKEITDKDESII